MLYARAITLRNCGRFTVIASDFGSDYRTHTHVTSEALYASLTRGATWNPHLIDLKKDPEDFTLAYDVQAMPIWFLPGIFTANGSSRLPDASLDTTAFNVVHEFYPSTSKAYTFRSGNLEEKDRPYHVPTYGTIQAITPNHRLVTLAFSPRQELLEKYAVDQTFLLGKKRTMFQIMEISPCVEGQWMKRECLTPWLELPPGEISRFRSFQVMAATMRYVLLRGQTREEISCVNFQLQEESFCLPDFYLERLPFPIQVEDNPEPNHC
jgi:hypothetical protein